MTSERNSCLRRTRGFVARALRTLGRFFTPEPLPAPNRRLAPLLGLEDRRLLSAAPIGPEFRVNVTTGGEQRLFAETTQAVAVNQTTENFVVVWSSKDQDGDSWGVFGRRYTAQGLPQGGEFQVNSASSGEQRYASVAVAQDGSFVVTWADKRSGDWDVYARRFDTAGTPAGVEFRVNATTSDDQKAPAVAIDGAGAILVTWASRQSSDWDVYARSFDSGGNPLSGESRVNAQSSQDQVRPTVGMAPGGNAVIAWASKDQDGDSWGVYGQRFAAGLNPQGGEFQVNTTVAGAQLDPAVAMDPAGNFAIAWASKDQDGDSWGVYARRYDAAGAAQGAEFQVNTHTAKEQERPAITMSAGAFVVSWESNGQDGSQDGVYARRYDATGAALGGEFLVNTTVYNDQFAPAVGMGASGNFVVVWDGNGPGDGSGVFGQRFEVAGIRVTPTSGLVTNETGASAAFTVVLTTQPAADVTVGVSSSDTTEGTVSRASLTFTTTNWATPQVVAVQGVDDGFLDGAVAYTIVTAPAVSADPSYNGLDAPNVAVTNNDNGTAGVTVSPTFGLRTSEAGGPATFTIVLNTAPLLPVTINVSSSDPSEGTASVASRTFTLANWDTPQTVTLTGVNDPDDDGDRPYTIALTVSTLDTLYLFVTAPSVSVVNADDDSAGIILTPTSAPVTTEAGGAATFTVVLTSRPTAAVTVPIASGNTAEGTVSTSTLTFTPVNWNVAQTVTATGVDDLLADGDVTYTIDVGPASSSDPAYDGLTAGSVEVTNLDDEGPPRAISGTVYEDRDGDGSLADGVARVGVTVRLYRDDGNGTPDAGDTFVTATTTDAAGGYTFTSLPAATYWVTVDARTVTPSAGFNPGFGQGDVWAEQTYGPAGSTSFDGAAHAFATTAGTFFGGMRGQVSDNAAAQTTAEHMARIPLGSTDAAGVDFGFSFTVVTRTGDGDDDAGTNRTVQGSLRQFLQNANAIAGIQTSRFALRTTDPGYDAGTGSFTIRPTSALPTVTDPVVLDGTTQQGFANRPAIELSGQLAGGSTDGLVITAGGSTVRGIAVNRFGGNGILLTGGGGNLIQGNYLGTDVTGTVALGNALDGLHLDNSAGNQIGDTTAAEANVIASNGVSGIAVFGDASTGNKIRGNAIFANGGLGIDLGAAGVTANDVGDGDTGANGLRNYPVLNWAVTSGGQTTIVGALDSLPNRIFTLDFYASPSTDSSGYGEGRTYLGWIDRTTDASGNASFQIISTIPVAVGDWVSATSTDQNGNTSEFSFAVRATFSPAITVTPGSGLFTTEAGGTATFQVVLDTQPTANVTISMASSDTTEGTVGPATLTFTPANWNVPQTVTVTGVDDFGDDDDAPYTIVLDLSASSDLSYAGLAPVTVNLTNRDDDSAGILVTGTSGLLIPEGGTATFAVRLTSQPTAMVHVGVASTLPGAGTVSSSVLAFTPANWDQPQTVTVRTTDDNVANGDTTFPIVTAPASSADASYQGLDAADVPVTRQDNDTAPSPEAILPQVVTPAPGWTQPAGELAPPLDEVIPPPTHMEDQPTRRSSSAKPHAPTAGEAAVPDVWTELPPGGEDGDRSAAPGEGRLPDSSVLSINPVDAVLVNSSLSGAALSAIWAAAHTDTAPTPTENETLRDIITLAQLEQAERQSALGLAFAGVNLAAGDGSTPEPARTAPEAAFDLTQVLEISPRALLDVRAGRWATTMSETPPDPGSPNQALAAAGSDGNNWSPNSNRAAGVTTRLTPTLPVELLWTALDRAGEQLDTSRGASELNAAAVTGLVASAGYVLLNTRAGIWLVSLLAAKPLWRRFDPLDVLFAWEKEARAAGAGEDDESLVTLADSAPIPSPEEARRS